MNINRQTAFILASTNQGTFIVNKNDYAGKDGNYYGVGHDLLQYGQYDYADISLALFLLQKRKERFGEGVIALDCGANLGIHSIQWAKLMTYWGFVFSFEPQEHIYYALAGNTVLNNCFNIKLFNVALGSTNERISIPRINYLKNGSFGSFEIEKRDGNEFIGQEIDYENNLASIEKITIDRLNIERLDFLKIDVEGMELEVLNGAKNSIDKNKPYILIERIKSNSDEISLFLKNLGYELLEVGKNFLAIQTGDPVLNEIK